MTIVNEGAENVGYFTPAQKIPAGAAIGVPQTKLFTPLKIRGVEFHNRMFVSPMCTYSADQEGHLTDFHLVHLGAMGMRGPGLVMVEATAVSPEGRISPNDSGLWMESQMKPLRRIVEFAHSQNQKIGIQLAHAGRKASTTAPYRGYTVATEAQGGWENDVYGPNEDRWDENHAQPHKLTEKQYDELVDKFVVAAKRAVEIGFDVIEIHGAHGYLISSTVSPATNDRNDKYGGTFEKRILFPMEVVHSVRKAIPDTMPLFYRVTATDWLPKGQGWEIEDTVALAARLRDGGVDLIDVSSGGNHKDQRIEVKDCYQVPFAEKVKDQVNGILVGAVGMIRDGLTANEILESGKADVTFVAREFLRNPSLVLDSANQLGENVAWPVQYDYAVKGHRKLR
ncbi:putative NADPH dehydrogenase C23G7.10c [Schizosaccharomyces pombe]